MKLQLSSISLGLFLTVAPHLYAAISVVAPNEFATLESPGSPNAIFTAQGEHTQIVYSSNQFSMITTPQFVTGIAFRQDGLDNFPFSITLNELAVSLSTTNRQPDNLSLTYAENIGTNATVVMPRGAYTFTSNPTGPPGGPMAFDIVFQFSTPFLYDPSLGNLLLDIQHFQSQSSTGTFFMDTIRVTNDSMSRINGPVGSSVAGGADTVAPVTKFTFSTVPEPSSIMLVMATFGSLLLVRTR
jgi:hypothetical protein